MDDDDFVEKHHAQEHAIIGMGGVVILAARSRDGHLIAITLESPDICRAMAEGLLAASRATYGTDQIQAECDA